jgi:histidinol-phosphate/aromatic aminotransferase/cobyric acid decarboxylase-like protein|tara:strand:- start:75 stop:311 length:237 start_codon:yes stop_codon:yes gene_type:complete
MKTKETTDWSFLLSTARNRKVMKQFATGSISASAATQAFAHSDYAGEFRKLLRVNGTLYARRLARKALRYRGIMKPTN